MTKRRADPTGSGRRRKPNETPKASEVPKSPPAQTQVGLASPVALVIDDEPANRDFLVRLLQQAKLDVRGAATGAEALALANECDKIGLIAVDNRLPDMDGIKLMRQLREQHPEARMIMATMLDERALMTEAFEGGCDVFLVKPHGFMDLFKRLQKLSAGQEDTLQRLIIDRNGPRPYRT